jgi:hypothetical protein
MSDPIPLVHVTDLYHPHVDPDDHVDLATVYGLANRGRIDLRGVVIDHPPASMDGGRSVEPGIQAVAQLDHLTGSAVRTAVGTSIDFSEWLDSEPDEPMERSGVDFIVETLESADRKVAITVAGGATDVAIAARTNPDLFAANCRGIYLNAGLGSPDPSAIEDSSLEYNVALDPPAFAAIFEAPCPIYWLPCFSELIGGMDETVTEHGTYWAFEHADVVPHLSDGLKNYFVYMYSEVGRTGWLRFLESPPDPIGLEKLLQGRRRMWCTAGLLHAAGLAVTPDGELCPRGDGRGVYTFDPVRVEVDAEGHASWERSDEGDRYKFRVRDLDAYEGAMRRALVSVLSEVG